LKLFIKLIGTFGFTGFFPIAPATFASAVFCAIYWLVPGGHWLAHPIVCLATLIVSVPVSTALEKDYGEDPSCVVIDEVVGLQVILVGVSQAAIALVPIIAVFALFRFFDILKPFPINRSQKLPGGWGIVIDDFLAGIYSRVALVLLSIWLPSLSGFGV